MRKLSGGRRGQSGVIDALLFFFILILAATFLDLSTHRAVEETVLKRDDIRFARATLSSLLRCTVNRTNYTEEIGGETREVELLHKNVLELIEEDLMLRGGDRNIDVSSLEAGIESEIRDILHNLTAYTFTNKTRVRNYHYSLRGEFREASFQLNDTVPGYPERYSAQTTGNMPGEGKYEITLLLWPA